MRNIENEGPLPWIPATGSMIVLGGEISVIGLELGVACLQAYIFSLLSCIYLQESVAERKVTFPFNLRRKKVKLNKELNQSSALDAHSDF